MLNIEINEYMVYDPDVACTIFPLRLWQDLGKPVLSPVPTLQAYTISDRRGQVTVDVMAFCQQKSLTAIVDIDGVRLFGLDLHQAFDLKLPPGVTVRNVLAECFSANAELNKLLANFFMFSVTVIYLAH